MNTHDELAKNAFDEALLKWKRGDWSQSMVSAEVVRTRADKTFPSPDATLYDDIYKRTIALEFKPPTEGKRGILTGLGQAVSYLQDASMSYLVAPKEVNGDPQFYRYLQDLFETQVKGNLPIGLICYDDPNARQVEILVEIDSTLNIKKATGVRPISHSYWANYQDGPPHLCWIILDTAYSLSSSNHGEKELWRNVWDRHLFTTDQANTLEVTPTKIMKHDGTPLYRLDKVKRDLQLQVDKGAMTLKGALATLRQRVDPDGKGDNLYHSYRKNDMPFMKHLQLLDDSGHLTEDGFELHKTGLVHGPDSQVFKDLLARTLLFNGKHLELIHDVEKLTRNKDYQSPIAAISGIKKEFLEKGLYRENPNRRVDGDRPDTFLKMERIIWGQLGLLLSEGNSQFEPGKGFHFNWKRITQLCSGS
ncbi:hypothetical protein FIM08_01805 [SAR202 cluster bacterium AC-647-N09_OGT_505m]|nr:hypothetical protein [SAR202 cluster bacterium AC-647-N09_OGT_505m]